MTPVATAVPLGLRLHVFSDAVVAPAMVAAAVEWDALAPCVVLDAHASIEVHVRATLVAGQRPWIVDETAIVTGHGDVVPRYPGDGAEALPLTGPLFPGAHGRLPCAIPLGGAHPTVHTPSLDLAHTLVARVLLVGHDPLEVRRPIELHNGRDSYRHVEFMAPATRHAHRTVPPAIEVPARHARPGEVVTGTAWPGHGTRTTVSLRRASFIHALGDPGGGPVARHDEVVAETVVRTDESGAPFSLELPPDAAPTCVTRFGSVRWFVRTETTVPASRWRRKPASASTAEVELNVHTG